MASATIPASLAPATVRPAAAPIPWYLWSLTFAVALVTLGGQVDVSWHRSIGRDTFWTPPHMMVYACGLIAGFTCARLILAATFGADPILRASSVSIFGLRAPLGVFLTAWGGLTMLYSAPVDNWWHNAYGLDVRVWSPPHVLLLAGTAGVGVGTLLLAAAHLNRATPGAPSQTVSPFEVGSTNLKAYQRLFLAVASLAVIQLMSYAMGYTFDTRLHQAKPYIVLATGVPFTLAAIAATARRRWTATWIAAIYTVFMLALVWGLPLIPATPRIGPVYENVVCMIPPKFPILLLVPAFALDLIRQSRISGWRWASVSGFAWTGLLAAVEWPFATFLMSPYAANRFFGTRFVDFGTPPDNPDALRIFEAPQHGLHLYAGLLLAAVIATLAIRSGELFGRWTRHLYR